MLEIPFRREIARLVAGALTSGVLTSSRWSHVRRRKVFLTQATTKSGPCQMRSKTESPCHYGAVVEIHGIPLCVGCAREQEMYFDGIGAARHHQVGIKALHLLTNPSKPPDHHLCVRTEPAQGALQSFSVDLVALLVGDQDAHVFHLTLSIRASSRRRGPH